MTRTLLSMLLLALIFPFASAEMPGLHDRGRFPIPDPNPGARYIAEDPVSETRAEEEGTISDEIEVEEETGFDEGDESIVADADEAEGPGDCANPKALAFKKVARVLELTEEQRNDWREMLKVRRETVGPLRDALAENRREMKAFLEDPDADPAIGGELLQESKSLRDAIREAHRTYVEDFQAMLDAEQARKLKGIRAAAKAQPLIPAFRKTGLVAPPKKRR